MQYSYLLSLTLSIATLVGHVALVALTVSFIFPSARKHIMSALSKILPHLLWGGFVISTTGVILSLVYSNIIGYPPCSLCWWQRVFLYPQAIIFTLALFGPKNPASTAVTLRSSLILSVFGAAIAAFQYVGQMLNPSILGGCETAGISCAKIYFVHFGYITLPLMSLTAFVFLILLSLVPALLKRATK